MKKEFKNEPMKIYFYNGMDKPKLLANSIKELKKVVISDNYLGDCTNDFQEVINETKNIDELQDELYYYDMYINPTLKDLVNVTLSWFNKYQFPYDLLSELGTKVEINKILGFL